MSSCVHKHRFGMHTHTDLFWSEGACRKEALISQVDLLWLGVCLRMGAADFRCAAVMFLVAVNTTFFFLHVVVVTQADKHRRRCMSVRGVPGTCFLLFFRGARPRITNGGCLGRRRREIVHPHWSLKSGTIVNSSTPAMWEW